MKSAARAACQSASPFLHGGARLRVEGAEGLVHQEDVGRVHEHARDGDPLLHPA
jgi:hypothetical protein